MSTTIQELSLQVESNADSATKPIRDLASAMGELKKNSGGGFNSVEKLASHLSTLNDSLSKFDTQAATKLAQLAWSLNQLNGLKVNASLATQLKKINEVVWDISAEQVNILGQLVSNLKDFAGIGKISLSGIKDIQKAAAAAAQGAAGVTAKDSESSTTTAAENDASTTNRLAKMLQLAHGVSATIRELPTGFRAFKQDIADTLPQFEGLKRLISGISKASGGIRSAIGAVSGFSNEIKSKFTLGVLGGENALNRLFSAFKRIALYRGIRFLFKELTNSFKEGMNNLYQYSLLMGTEFAGSMDRLATAFLYFKNSVGAAASPIVNALAPAIDYAIDKIVQLLNWINQLVSRLRGASVWTKAVKYATSYAGAADRAAGSTRKAAKALKDYTIGIDELNVIRPDDDTGSGGGGGAGSDIPDYSKMFEEVPIDNAVSNFADRIKEAINNENWVGLGTLLGSKINIAINRVPWSKIGTRIGKLFNGAVQTLYYTLDTIDWTNLGKQVAKLLNKALSNIDFSFVGRILVKGVTIGFDLLIGFIKELDFGQLATSISQFLIGAMDEASGWIENVDWAKLGSELFTKLTDFVSNVDWAGVVGSAFELIGSILGGGAALLGGFFGDAWEKLKEYFTENGEFTWEGFLDGIINGLKDIGKWIIDNIWTPFKEGFKKAFGIASPSEEMKPLGGFVIEGMLQGIIDGLTNIGTWVKDNIFSPIWNNILKAFGINSGESKETEKQGKALPAGLYSGTRKSIPGGQSTFTSWATKTLSWFSGSGSNSTQNKFGSEGEGIVKSFNKKTGVSAFSTKDIMTTWAGNIKTWFSTEASADSFSTFALNVVDGFKNGISNFGSRVYETVTGWAKNVKKWFSNEMDEHSPSKVFYGFGENVVLGFNNAITDVGRTSLRTVQDWSASIQRGFAPMLSVDYSNIAGMNDYVGAMSATASYNASVQAEASFVDESLMPVLQAIAEATTRQANKSETAVVRVNGRDLLSAMDTQRKANGYRVAY